MILHLNGLKVACIIGDRAHERTHPQTLLIDVSLVLPVGADETDALKDTIDYVALSEAIRAALVAARCQMIEHAAKIVHDMCAAQCAAFHPDADVAGVTVTKTGTLPQLESVSVSYP